MNQVVRIPVLYNPWNNKRHWGKPSNQFRANLRSCKFPNQSQHVAGLSSEWVRSLQLFRLNLIFLRRRELIGIEAARPSMLEGFEWPWDDDDVINPLLGMGGGDLVLSATMMMTTDDGSVTHAVVFFLHASCKAPKNERKLFQTGTLQQDSFARTLHPICKGRKLHIWSIYIVITARMECLRFSQGGFATCMSHWISQLQSFFPVSKDIHPQDISESFSHHNKNDMQGVKGSATTDQCPVQTDIGTW